MRFRNRVLEAVAAAVEKGLSADLKSLPSWLLYDARGDELFQEIMNLPEYYPTNCERSIIEQQVDRIAAHFISFNTPFDLVELGAGDGTKTEIILQHLESYGIDFCYVPVDISENVLSQLQFRLSASLPGIDIRAVNMRNEDAVSLLSKEEKRKVMLFLGANIGNYTAREATLFFKEISGSLHKGDLFVVGFDLVKDPRVIARAYNDRRGVTREFNFNLLHRLNRELGADFIPENFIHYPTYDPATGEAKSYLVSIKKQEVFIAALERKFVFQSWEPIFVEISRKYNMDTIRSMAKEASFRIVDILYDERKYFCDVIFARA